MKHGMKPTLLSWPSMPAAGTMANQKRCTSRLSLFTKTQHIYCICIGTNKSDWTAQDKVAEITIATDLHRFLSTKCSIYGEKKLIEHIMNVSFWIKTPTNPNHQNKYLPFQNTYQLISSFPNAPFHKNQRTEEETPPVTVSLATSPTCSSWLSTFWSDVLAAPGSQVFTFSPAAWHGGTSAGRHPMKLLTSKKPLDFFRRNPGNQHKKGP